MNTNGLIVEYVTTPTKEFEGRPYWSCAEKVAGRLVAVRWVADAMVINGEEPMDGAKFTAHAQRIFNRLRVLAAS